MARLWREECVLILGEFHLSHIIRVSLEISEPRVYQGRIRIIAFGWEF